MRTTRRPSRRRSFFRRLKAAFLLGCPIPVRKEERTRGHLVIAMLALKVLHRIEQGGSAVF
ncbi:MAG: hypothetical protein P8Y25_05375 [Chromatiaceae bacterium]